MTLSIISFRLISRDVFSNFYLFLLFTKNIPYQNFQVLSLQIFNMYHCGFISIVASWPLFFFLVSSNNFDDLLWDPNSQLKPGDLTLTTTTPPSTVDDLGSGPDFLKSDDSAELISVNNTDDDDDQSIFANTASQSSCSASAADDAASEFNIIKARDHPSCSSGQTGSSSAILSPESIQLFQDPTTSITNLVSPQKSPSTKKKRPSAGPSGSGEPPDPFFIPTLSREETNRKFNNDREEMEFDFDDLREFLPDGNFFCSDEQRRVPVCGGGPFEGGFLQDCDPCKMRFLDENPPCPIPHILSYSTC